MAVVNRCAIGVGPKDPLVLWSRQVSRSNLMEWGGDDHSLYLIPTYGSEEEALDLLREGFEAIFAAELDFWCRDPATWPSPRTFELFLEWFEIRFYPLVEDLCEEELDRDVVDEDFFDQVRSALEILPEN